MGRTAHLYLRSVSGLFLAGLFFLTQETAACGVGPDQIAFTWALVEDATPQPNGQMLLEYRDEESLKITHVSYHQVSRILPGIELSLSEAEAERHSLLFIEGTFGPLTYVIFKEALYYGTDLDNVGLPRRVWLDSEEDGLNGNELLVFDRFDTTVP
jgi:hypothetical protein